MSMTYYCGIRKQKQCSDSRIDTRWRCRVKCLLLVNQIDMFVLKVFLTLFDAWCTFLANQVSLEIVLISQAPSFFLAIHSIKEIKLKFGWFISGKSICHVFVKCLPRAMCLHLYAVCESERRCFNSYRQPESLSWIVWNAMNWTEAQTMCKEISGIKKVLEIERERVTESMRVFRARDIQTNNWERNKCCLALFIRWTQQTHNYICKCAHSWTLRYTIGRRCVER